MKNAFSAIYARRAWGMKSGAGSAPQALGPYYSFLNKILRDASPATVVDLGCGFFSPYQHVDWGKARYIGIDVISKCIHENSQFAKTNRTFLEGDWSTMNDLPKGELAICKDVLQHWSHDDIMRGLKILVHYPLAMLTNSISSKHGVLNENIETGEFRPLNLLIEPYLIQAKEAMIYPVSTSKGFDWKQIILWKP